MTVKNDASYHPSVKLLIVSFVAILSAFFFWNTSQRFLYPSKASQTSLKVFFNTDSVKTDTSGTATIDIFMAGDKDMIPDSATVPLRYNPDEVDFMMQNDMYADSLCRTNGWLYEQSSILTFEPKTGNLIVAKTKNETDDPDGIVCWGSYVFTLKPGVSQSIVSFGSNGWDLRAGSAVLEPNIKESNQVVIKR